jgi:hypothetical protein
VGSMELGGRVLLDTGNVSGVLSAVVLGFGSLHFQPMSQKDCPGFSTIPSSAV